MAKATPRSSRLSPGLSAQSLGEGWRPISGFYVAYAPRADTLGARDDAGLAEVLSTLNRAPDHLMLDKSVARPDQRAAPGTGGRLGYLRTAMLLDRERYLPDDVLVKVDRATMAVSLESRAPLLDHRIVEFASSLPLDYLRQGAVGKRVLREVLYRHVPRRSVDRPKQGFSLPMARWLRHELRDWSQDMLNPADSKATVLDLRACRRLLDGHQQGSRDASAALWPALMLQSWMTHHGASA